MEGQDNIFKQELKWSWDGTRDRETLIVRRMLYDNPKQVIEDYGKDYLKKLFLEKIHLFDRVNENFWRVILKVSDEEIDRATKENPRLGCKIWNL